MSDKKVESLVDMVSWSPKQTVVGESGPQNPKTEFLLRGSENKISVSEMEKIVFKLIDHIKEK
jgi:hypothetical protein